MVNRFSLRFANGSRMIALPARTRHGQQFIYSCSVPPIGLDLVSSCASPPGSFYRLPFSGGSHLWEIDSGNNSAFTHNGSGGWSFDFTALEGTPILEATVPSV